jgi:hypothetical protein
MDAAKGTLEACVSLMMQAMNFKSIRDRDAPLHKSIEPTVVTRVRINI